jgi:hypothetical protein
MQTRLQSKQTGIWYLVSSIWYLSSAPKALAAITNTAVPGGSTPADSPKQFAVTIATLWQTIILVGGLAFILYFLMGGIQWIMAGGDKGKLEESKNRITQGLIGLCILAASYVIIKFIETAIGMDLLNISWPTAG